MSGLQYNGPICMQTRLRRHIDNAINWMVADDGARLQVAALKRKYSDASQATHRDVGPCQTYNCHGLTFASRRTVIDKAAEVEQILRDDGYKAISWKEVMAGDIAIYRMPSPFGQEVHHSGIVVERGPARDGLRTIPKILSKWGHAHEVIHNENYCEYVGTGTTIEYYRLER